MLNPLPVNPAKILFKFPTRTCGFDPSNLAPPVYSISQSTTLPGVNVGTLEFTENTLALFTPATSTTTPTNNSQLQSLIQKFSSDFLNWRQTQFDIVLAGIANVAQNGLIQVTEFDYNSDMCRTRITSLPDNFPPDRLAHQLATLSTDCPNTDDSNTAEPCFKGYGPPSINQVSGSTTFDEFLLCFQDGRLTETFLQTVTYNCGCGGSPGTCHASIMVTGCGGTPLAGATVSINGIGTTTTDALGNAILTLPSPGTYSGTVSFTGFSTVPFSHNFTCPSSGLTVSMTGRLLPGFGCCSGGYPQPLPLTLFASVCGIMITLTATATGMPGDIIISNWSGSGTIPGQTVAKFPTVPCAAGTWDGITTTSGSVDINVVIECSGSAAPPVLADVGISSTSNETTNFITGPCDPLANPGCCGGSILAYSDSIFGCGGATPPLTGTWGPVVSASGTIGSFIPSEGSPNGCGPSGLSCGGSIEITS